MDAFKAILIWAFVLIGVPAFGYLPPGLWILEKTVKKQTAFVPPIEIELTFSSGEKWREVWLADGGAKMKWQSQSPQGQLIQGEVTFKSPESWFFERSANNLATRLVQKNWASSQIFNRTSPTAKEPITSESSFLRFSRAAGVVSYHFSNLENQGLWIEQDRFLVRQIAEGDFKLIVREFTEIKESTVPKKYEIHWGDQVVLVEVTKVREASKKIVQGIAFKEFDKSSLSPQVVEFYERFR